MKIKGFLKDVGGASRVTKVRQAKFDAAESTSKHYDPIGAVARALHPGFIELEVVDIFPVSPTTKTIVFTAPHIPYFKAGQFMTLVLPIGNSRVTRPYSISSAPYQTRGEKPIVELTVRAVPEDKGGFASLYLYNEVKVGDKFMGEVGLGEFHVDPIRDAKKVVALVGGSGVTPFLSMAREVKHGDLDIDLTILFGSVTTDDIILEKQLDECVCDKVKVVHVLSGDDPNWKGERGFLSAELISKYAKGDVTFFVCGPQVMYDYVSEQLKKLGVPARRIRLEVFGQARDVTSLPRYPKSNANKVFNLTVKQGLKETVIPARGDEPIAVALERAGMKIHIGCRSGACGFCRLKVLSGNYYVSPHNDGRRAADKDYGYVHACATYPLGDMAIKVNID